MAYKSVNYAAFYVSEPFDPSNLGASATKDFSSYNLLKAWKANDDSFPFLDSHNKNYNVRDGSDWERTLKPRLRNRLSDSKNIILFLSSTTKISRALQEELNYGANTLGLPIIVVYPEYDDKRHIINCKTGSFRQQIKELWGKSPDLQEAMRVVPTIHIPYKKELIRMALNNKDFMINTKTDISKYYYPC